MAAGGRENAPVVTLLDLVLEVLSPSEFAGRGYISFILVVDPPLVAVVVMGLLTAEGRLAGVAMALVVTLDSALNMGSAMLEIFGVDGVELEPDPLFLLNIMGGRGAMDIDKWYWILICTVLRSCKGKGGMPMNRTKGR